MRFLRSILEAFIFKFKEVGGYAYFNLDQANDILVANTYQKLAGVYNNAKLENFEVINDKLTYIGTIEMSFIIWITGNLSFPVNNKIVKLAVEYNGTILDSNRACLVFCDVANKPYPYFHFAEVTLKYGDTIDFGITCDSTGIVTVKNFSTLIKRGI